MKVSCFPSAALLLTSALAGADAPAEELAAAPLPVVAEQGPVAMMSEPNSRSERALLRRGGHRGEKLLLFLWKEGTLQRICGEDGCTISPMFRPTELFWMEEDELACYSPEAAPLPPCGEEARAPRRARLLLVQLQRGEPVPAAPRSKNSWVHQQADPRYRASVLARELRSEFPAGMDAADALHHDTAVLLWSCGESIMEALSSEKPAPVEATPALRARAEQALAAYSDGEGWCLGEISPANGRGERVVTLRRRDSAKNARSQPWAQLALLTAEGTLHPLVLPNARGAARTRLRMERVEWVAEDIFSIFCSQPDAHECWQLADENSAAPARIAERLGLTVGGSPSAQSE